MRSAERCGHARIRSGVLWSTSASGPRRAGVIFVRYSKEEERAKMCDFKFEFSTDFGNSCEDASDGLPRESSNLDALHEDADCKDTTKLVPLRPAKEMTLSDDHPSQKGCSTVTIMCGDVALSYLNPEDVETNIHTTRTPETTEIEQAIASHSDLVPCVYEGGLKVWECSLDLVHFLSEQSMPLSGRLVLELGCGAGLPGIYAMKKGSVVHFQDYNEEALKLMTIPNVLLNPLPDGSHEKCRFFSGDWSLVQQLIDEQDIRYDVILTSETIYSITSQPRLYNIIRRLLKPSGKVYLAAKTHYFGVGGGTRQFEDFVRERGEFDIAPCKVISQGLKREVLEMTFVQGEVKGGQT